MYSYITSNLQGLKGISGSHQDRVCDSGYPFFFFFFNFFKFFLNFIGEVTDYNQMEWTRLMPIARKLVLLKITCFTPTCTVLF